MARRTIRIPTARRDGDGQSRSNGAELIASLDRDLARTEPDPEIHALIHDSAGLNLALDYLPGSVSYDPLVHKLDPELAARVLWFDAYVSNVDRTARNTNMLMWHRRPWLIDHGASLYFHHSPGWHAEPERARSPFPGIKEHVLLRQSSAIADLDAQLAGALTADVIRAVLATVPDAWLADDLTARPAAAGREARVNSKRQIPNSESHASEMRAAYERYLLDRLAPPRAFVEEAARVR